MDVSDIAYYDKLSYIEKESILDELRRRQHLRRIIIKDNRVHNGEGFRYTEKIDKILYELDNDQYIINMGELYYGRDNEAYLPIFNDDIINSDRLRDCIVKFHDIFYKKREIETIPSRDLEHRFFMNIRTLVEHNDYGIPYNDFHRTFKIDNAIYCIIDNGRCVKINHFMKGPIDIRQILQRIGHINIKNGLVRITPEGVNQIKLKYDKYMNTDIGIVAIYRDDDKHERLREKRVFVYVMNKIMANYGINSRIYIIEQSSDGQKFNIGKLKNIGYQKAKHHNMIIFTDIDMIPDTQLMRAYVTKHDGVCRLAHRGTRYGYVDNMFFGAVLSFSPAAYSKINGYPNSFYGWGGEDTAIGWRCVHNKIPIYYPEHGAVIDIELNENRRVIYSAKEKLEILKKTNTKDMKLYEKVVLITKQPNNGVTTLIYNDVDTKQYDTYTIIIVDLQKDAEEKQHPEWFDMSVFSEMSDDDVEQEYRKAKSLLHLNKHDSQYHAMEKPLPLL